MLMSSIAAAIHRLLNIQADNWWVTHDRDGWHIAIDHIDQGHVTTAGPFPNRAEAVACGRVIYGEASYLATQ
jgi:hypothetical protein